MRVQPAGSGDKKRPRLLLGDICRVFIITLTTNRSTLAPWSWPYYGTNAPKASGRAYLSHHFFVLFLINPVV